MTRAVHALSADRGEPTITTLPDGTIIGYDPGFGPELATMVVARRNEDGSITILETRTWDPTHRVTEKKKGDDE